MNSDVVVDIVTELAERKGVEPTDLEFSLANHIDIQAVEAVATHGSKTCQLTFQVPGYEVAVFGTGTFKIEQSGELTQRLHTNGEDLTTDGRFNGMRGGVSGIDLPPDIGQGPDGLPDVCFVYDQHGHQLDVLARPDRTDLVIGEPDEFIGRPIHEIFPESVAKTFITAIRTALREDRELQFTVDVNVPAGDRTFAIELVPLDTDSVEKLVLNTARDITDARPEATKSDN